MIEFIFTIDYEIYGNGEGSLQTLVHEPAERLKDLFKKWEARFVAFVEAAELEAIEAAGSDPAIEAVKEQVRAFDREGFEIGLHLHPQWCNARLENGRWCLDGDEYNLCRLPQERIAEIVDRSLAYLRNMLGRTDFHPLSYRAGNWLFQPSQAISRVLAERGFRIDSSVYKGGLQHRYGLDYRRSLRNGYYWPFREDVNVPDTQGRLIEIPIFSKMVPTYRIFSSKRVGLQSKAPSAPGSRQSRIDRLKDFLRPAYPLKLDFCRLTVQEFQDLLRPEIEKDKQDPSVYRPLVAIGHTKDLVDFETVGAILAVLRERRIPISSFNRFWENIQKYI